MKKLFCVLTCLALFAACNDSPAGHGPSDGGESSVIFGVMSDTHVGAAATAKYLPETKLRKAYQRFAKEHPEMDAIVTVGDFSEHGTEAEYNIYKSIMEEESRAKNNLLVMGNHDNYAFRTSGGEDDGKYNGDAAVQQFKKVFGYEPTQDKVINGYHFISVSTRDGVYNTNSFNYHKEWLKKTLVAANAEDPRKPIFVFFHHTMANATVIGSLQGLAGKDGDLYEILKDYPQVVTFSGHTHVSTADPRNIWQGAYTALNCGSVFYTNLDRTHSLTKGETVNTQPPAYNSNEASTILILEVKGTVVTVRRIDSYWDVEIPAKFVFDTSKPKAEFPYLEENRVRASVPPAFASGAVISLDKIYDNGIEFTFPQAQTNNKIMPDDGAFTYEVSIKEVRTDTEADSFLLQANYFMLPRPETVSHNTNKLVADSHYKMSVTPIGFFGKKGVPLTISFQTAKKGAGAVRESYLIPVAMLPGTDQLPATGIPMDTFILMFTNGAMDLNTIYGIFGEPIFFQDENLQTPFTGTDLIYKSTIIHSLFPLEMLLSMI
jgi:3',5'-cyclic AMP phosphodiesterase CpdA